MIGQLAGCISTYHLFQLKYSPFIWSARHNKYLINFVFSVRTLGFGTSFLPLKFNGLCAMCLTECLSRLKNDFWSYRMVSKNLRHVWSEKNPCNIVVQSLRHFNPQLKEEKFLNFHLPTKVEDIWRWRTKKFSDKTQHHILADLAVEQRPPHW